MKDKENCMFGIIDIQTEEFWLDGKKCVRISTRQARHVGTENEFIVGLTTIVQVSKLIPHELDDDISPVYRCIECNQPLVNGECNECNKKVKISISEGSVDRCPECNQRLINGQCPNIDY